MKTDQHKETLIPFEWLKSWKVSLKHLEREDEPNLGDFSETILESTEMIIETIKGEDPSNLPKKVNQNNNPPLLMDDLQLKFTFSTFLVNNNLPFSTGPKLVGFIQEILGKYDTSLIFNSKITEQEISQITRYGMASIISDSIFLSLEKSPFSISIDEGNDGLGRQYLGLSVCYFPEESNKYPQNKFIGLIELADSSSGETLCNKVSDFLFNRPNGSQLRKNFMGMASDHARNMISGKEKGLAERLTVTFPHMFVIHDYSHAFNLVTKCGLEAFPSEIISTVNKICSMFSRSQNKAIPRWSSSRNCSDRILELIGPLRIFYTERFQTNHILDQQKNGILSYYHV